ncbi:MAG: bifunctional methionine sulfoxide reductase B/A protein [Bacteroidales bacterium]|nr:bifunctional methionine sulfoxide reductase B/A protein [Bacteroidales bacterium]
MKTLIIFILIVIFAAMSDDLKGQDKKSYNILTSFDKYVINEKGTEKPFTGKYTDHKEDGTYVCKQCGTALYKSDSKFDSKCGWPGFDDEIEGSVRRVPDADGVRTEIVCANCGGHLGHVFLGEGYTDLNIRHCVNSVSIDFVEADLEEGRYETSILAGGCFWGVEYYLQKREGVMSVTSGYIGGHVKNPSYKEVCDGKTGHAEAVKVIYDPEKISYEEVVKLFLEIHDPTQVDRQGPDVGKQYRSEIFYMNNYQKEIAEKLLDTLTGKGYSITTRVTVASEFYKAEDYHQDYYIKNSKMPYCHGYTKRF